MHPHHTPLHYPMEGDAGPSLNDSSFQQPAYSCISTVPPALTLTSLHSIDNAGKEVHEGAPVCMYMYAPSTLIKAKSQMDLRLLHIIFSFDGVN